MMLGAATCAFACVMRPKPGKVPTEDLASEKEFPALHALVNEVAHELGGQPIRNIVVNEDFNAAYGVFGWRRVPVLWIGLPLWMALRPQERLALLGHEVAHGINGDGTRSFVVWSALSALDEWISALREPLRHARHQPQPSPDTGPGFFLFLWLERKVCLLNCFGSINSGRNISPIISARRSRGQNPQCRPCGEWGARSISMTCCYGTRTVHRVYILGLFRQRICDLPQREWQRLARSSRREDSRLDASHPPTAHRVEFLDTHRVAAPLMVASESAMTAIDAELRKLEERLGGRRIARHARD
jgi:heat shock protein HtpX